MRRAMQILLVSVTLGLCACATQTSDAKRTPAESGSAAAPVPASSPLAKVQMGMNKTQVRELIGGPTDEASYSSGKAWIPFYFGNDARRTAWYYKGQGRVVFADGNVFGAGAPEVVRVDYDPSDPGHPR